MFIYTVWYEDSEAIMTSDIYENRADALRASRKHHKQEATKWIQVNTRTCAEWRHGYARWSRDLLDAVTKDIVMDIYCNKKTGALTNYYTKLFNALEPQKERQ